MPPPLRFAATALPACAAFLLSGCIARTAIDVVALPVRAVGAGVDAVTTSQAEADQKRGRELRRREERLGRLERLHAQAARRCSAGHEPACDDAARLRAEIEALFPPAPYPTRR